MKEQLLETELNIKNNKIRVMKVGNTDYICLTDLAKYKDKTRTDYIIQNWMRTTNTIIFLGTWEYLNNENFNYIEFDGFKKESGTHSFVLTAKRWIKATNAIGIMSKQGRYNSGTYAHPDIAFEFASWISPEFKLYLIKEFERLKYNEAYQYKQEWNVTRLLSKINYVVHTDAIKENIIPSLTEKQKQFVYVKEADVLNVALFGMTAKQWRDNNPKLPGNIRDYADLLYWVILNNLENINAHLISDNVPQKERLIKLNVFAQRQMKILINNKNIKELELIKRDINKENLMCENNKDYNIGKQEN